MNKERLLLVAKALRESKEPARFSMETYHRCGTPACAIGHYAARRDLQDFMQLAVYEGRSLLRFGVWGATTLAIYSGDYRENLASHFGIDDFDVENLFGMNGCGDAKTPVEAAAYIENFVNTP